MDEKLKEVLYLSYDGMTDPLGQSQVLPYIIGLTKEGYSFTIISFEKKEKFKESQSEIRKLLSEHNIIWHPLSYTKWPPIFSTVFDLIRLRKEATLLHKNYKFAIVHCRSYITALIGQWMKKKFGTKFIFDMRGFWADERVDGNIWKLSNPVFKVVYQFFKRKEKQFLEQADYTICLTHAAKNEIESWKRINRQSIPIAVIPCCVDMNLFNPEVIQQQDLDTHRVSLNLSKDDYVLSYLGSLGTWYMLDEMLDYFRELLSQKPLAKFLFITGDNPELIQQAAIKKSIPADSMVIIKSPRNQVPQYLSLSDSCIFFIKPSYSKMASSPTKQGEIMALGLPVVCNAGVGDTDYVVRKYDSGFVVQDFTIASYRTQIAQMLSVKLEKTKIIQGATDFYSLQKGIKSYSYVYQNLLQ
jgi:glycosyltransferase involved in cell wall biosynthesis